MNIQRRYLRELDWVLILVLMGLAVFSYLGISGANPKYNEETKQLIWYILGFAVLILLLFIDYHVIVQYSYILYGFGILLLIGLFFFGVVRNNAQSWYDLGFSLFQPSEIMKVFTILAIARYLSRRDEKELPFYHLYELWPLFLLVMVPVGLIVIQPDLGTSLVFAGILVAVLLMVNMPLRPLLTFFGIIIGVIAIFIAIYLFDRDLAMQIFHLQDYQLKRIDYWLHPEYDPTGDGFHLIQSLITVGSGRLTGKGLYMGTQAQNGWIPEGQTDFIFAVIAEEHGFLGASLLVMLYFLLLYRMIRIALMAKDTMGTYIVIGAVGMFVFQIFENIGMTIQLMPITGITLPFLSYGGTSLLTNFIMMSVVLNVGMRKQKLSFFD